MNIQRFIPLLRHLFVAIKEAHVSHSSNDTCLNIITHSCGDVQDMERVAQFYVKYTR